MHLRLTVGPLSSGGGNRLVEVIHTPTTACSGSSCEHHTKLHRQAKPKRWVIVRAGGYMSPDPFFVAADIATIIACIVTVIAVIISAYQFIATQKSSRETQAVELFIKFNQLNIEQSNSSNHVSDHWYNNCKFAITESIYHIAYKSKGWVSTVKWMLDQQAGFYSWRRLCSR
jgi:hypothetical protein